jgi:uncharacterized protein YbjQ (UPF0145 family)
LNLIREVKALLIFTALTIEGKRITKTLGLVRGNTIRARWIGRDIAAGLKHLVGGEIKSYTAMLSQAREEALNRMVSEAEKLGANAVNFSDFIAKRSFPIRELIGNIR